VLPGRGQGAAAGLYSGRRFDGTRYQSRGAALKEGLTRFIDGFSGSEPVDEPGIDAAVPTGRGSWILAADPPPGLLVVALIGAISSQRDQTQ
jgi:hypothetical protein